MGLWQILETATTVLGDMKRGYAIGQMVTEKRAVSTAKIKYIVKNGTPQQLDEFEKDFFEATLGMFGSNRIRAMELYAYFKILETELYGWRGFADEKPRRSIC